MKADPGDASGSEQRPSIAPIDQSSPVEGRAARTPTRSVRAATAAIVGGILIAYGSLQSWADGDSILGIADLGGTDLLERNGMFVMGVAIAALGTVAGFIGSRPWIRAVLAGLSLTALTIGAWKLSVDG